MKKQIRSKKVTIWSHHSTILSHKLKVAGQVAHQLWNDRGVDQWVGEVTLHHRLRHEVVHVGEPGDEDADLLSSTCPPPPVLCSYHWRCGRWRERRRPPDGRDPGDPGTEASGRIAQQTSMRAFCRIRWLLVVNGWKTNTTLLGSSAFSRSTSANSVL